MKLPKFFLNQPHFDPVTNRIVGCEEGTFKYYHELRHKQQNDDGWLLVMSFLLLISLTLVFIFQHWIFSVIGLFALFTIEIDAWIYSIEMKLMEKTK